MKNQSSKKCEICERIKQIEQGTNPCFVAEMQSGYVVIGDYQFFRGYSLFLFKEHKTELHQLERKHKMVFLEEMSILAEAVFRAFGPKKINYELLGNSIEHMHWHIFPRHKDDPRPIGPIWVIDKGIRYAESVRPSEDDLLFLKRSLLCELKILAKGKILRIFMLDLPRESGPMCYWPVVRSVPHARDVLYQLSQTSVCHLTTNAKDSDENQIRTALSRVDLDDFITNIYCFKKVGHLKPSPSFFEYIIQGLGVDRSSLVMVGDDLEMDILGAMKFGLGAIWYNPKRAQAPDGIQSIANLMDLLSFHKDTDIM
jgi:FMN phosphatase YigB (HAD superfamily)